MWDCRPSRFLNVRSQIGQYGSVGRGLVVSSVLSTSNLRCFDGRVGDIVLEIVGGASV